MFLEKIEYLKPAAYWLFPFRIVFPLILYKKRIHKTHYLLVIFIITYIVYNYFAWRTHKVN